MRHLCRQPVLHLHVHLQKHCFEMMVQYVPMAVGYPETPELLLVRCIEAPWMCTVGKLTPQHWGCTASSLTCYV